jgi:hypothetical protein
MLFYFFFFSLSASSFYLAAVCFTCRYFVDFHVPSTYGTGWDGVTEHTMVPLAWFTTIGAGGGRLGIHGVDWVVGGIGV